MKAMRTVSVSWLLAICCKNTDLEGQAILGERAGSRLRPCRDTLHLQSSPLGAAASGGDAALGECPCHRAG